MAELHRRRTCTRKRCADCRNIRRASLALLTNPRARLTNGTYEVSDPVLWIDAQTSYHDLRAALCFASGAGVDEVDPATGHYLGVWPR